jgi:hypothetical protein
MGERGSQIGQRTAPADPGPVMFSNDVRLTGRQWLGAGLFAALLIAFAPSLWQRIESFHLDPDQRMPHDLSNDYWLYERYAALAAANYDTLLLGDSVIWGEYVTGQETLSHYLNELAGSKRYANLGLDGAHPLALTGLIDHYGGSITRKNVLLHCNPLWMSSHRADLQDEKSTDFNHPRLVPQFVPKIPSYKEEASGRIGILVEQHLPFSRWTTHLQQAYYDRTDLPSWTLEHPYANPLEPLAREPPVSDNSRRHLPQPWYQSGISKQDYPWVDPETSLQWQAFQRLVRRLQQRGNRLFVLVGPFNEHLLERQSLARYEVVKETIAAWLQGQQIAHAVPVPLGSALYGDASHPLAAGYAVLARQLAEMPFFRSRTLPAVSGP